GVRPELELDRLVPALLAHLGMEERPRAGGAPDAAALPARAWVVDAPVHVLGKPAAGVRHDEADELAVLEGVDRIRQVRHHDRHVLAEPQDAFQVDPGVVASLRAALGLHVAQLRSWQRIEGPALGAMLAKGARPVRDLALGAVE